MQNYDEEKTDIIYSEKPATEKLELADYVGRELTISVNRIIKFLSYTATLLILLSLTGQIYRYFYNDGAERYITYMFNLDEEINFPTYFSSLMLISASFISMFIASVKKKSKEKYYLNWMIITVVLFIMSMDEILMLHEQLSAPIRSMLHTQGFFYFAWLIPALFSILILLAININFFFNFSRIYQKGFFTSAFIYLLGAFIMEMIGGKFLSFYGQNNFGYALVTTFEETLELIGLILSIKFLLLYIKNELQNVSLKLE